MTASPSLITEPAPSFWAEQDRVIDSPPILRARPEDGRHDQLGIFQTALLGRITQASTLSKAATSASTACDSSALAPLRKTSVSGSAKVPGCESWKTLVWVTAYHSFGGEVEASNTPTIRRLTPSCRHQLSPIARRPLVAVD